MSGIGWRSSDQPTTNTELFISILYLVNVQNFINISRNTLAWWITFRIEVMNNQLHILLAFFMKKIVQNLFRVLADTGKCNIYFVRNVYFVKV